MWVSKFCILFILFGIVGWAYESIYAVVKTGKWENRGFLYGPLCPIYGVGAAGVTLLRLIILHAGLKLPAWWVTFLVCCIGSFFLEYGTHYLLEKLFHACWWDYSDSPLNLNGRVCLPASLAFGVAGVLILYKVAPGALELMRGIPGEAAEIVCLLLMSVFAADVTVTVCVLTDFSRRVDAVSTLANQRMENLVEDLGERKASATQIIGGEGSKLYAFVMDSARRSMGSVYRSALSRVQVFKPDLKRHPLQTLELMNRLRRSLKEEEESLLEMASQRTGLFRDGGETTEDTEATKDTEDTEATKGTEDTKGTKE